MSRYLDTRGKSSLGVGICDRCGRKFPIGDLRPDRDNKGLLVCDEDNDQYDPYKLPARKPESVLLRTIRPDVDVGIQYIRDMDGNYIEDEEGGYIQEE